MQRQQRGVELDHPAFRDGAEFRRREQQDVRHHTEIGVELSERLFCFIARVFGMAMDGQPAFLRRHDERVGPRARPLRRREHAGYLVSASHKGLQHGFAEGLLADDYDTHLVFLRLSRQTAKFHTAELQAEASEGKLITSGSSEVPASPARGSSRVTAVPRPTSLRIDAEPPDWRANP